MVSHSNYSKNKAFKKENIKQQFIRKKKKKKKETSYLKNKNKLNGKNTRKRKHTKKGEQYKGSLKSKKKTPININKNKKNLKPVLLKQQDGGGIFSSCISVSIDKKKSKYDKLDSKLKKNLGPFSNIMDVMKKSYLKVLKEQYYTLLINKRKKFNQEKKRDEVKGDKTLFDNQIKILDGNIQDSNNKIKIKLKEATKKMKKYKKIKKKYDSVSKNYMKFVDKLMYGSKKGKAEPDKKSFNYKMNQILNIIESAESTSEGSEDRKKYNKCKKKYDKAKSIYTDIKSKIGANIFTGDTLNNDIVFIDAFITKSGLKHTNDISKFKNEWEGETNKFYNEIIKLVPEQSVDSIKTNTSIKSLDYKKDVERIEGDIINVYNIFYQVNESTLNINVVRVLEHIKQFMNGIKETQGGIVKDLRKLKEGFLNLQNTSILKLMSNYIIRAHLQNTKLLICIKYYFENISNQNAVELFTKTSTYSNTDPNKRIGLAEGLGVGKSDQNVFEQQVSKAPAAPIPIEKTNLTSSVSGGIMRGGGKLQNILDKDRKFKFNKQQLEHIMKSTNLVNYSKPKFDKQHKTETELKNYYKKHNQRNIEANNFLVQAKKISKLTSDIKDKKEKINDNNAEINTINTKIPAATTAAAIKKKLTSRKTVLEKDNLKLTDEIDKKEKQKEELLKEVKFRPLTEWRDSSVKKKYDTKSCKPLNGQKDKCYEETVCYYNENDNICSTDFNISTILKKINDRIKELEAKQVSNPLNSSELIELKKLKEEKNKILPYDTANQIKLKTKEYEEHYKDYFEFKKKYYLTILYFYIIYDQFKDIDVTEDTLSNAKENFKKTSLYSTYYDMFDIIDPNINFYKIKVGISKFKENANRSDKLKYIKTSVNLHPNQTDLVNDKIEDALKHFIELYQID